MREIIRMKDVSKVFIQNNEEIIALNNINLSVNEGELVGVLGPSGSGKSTFLTILGGLQTATSGEVIIDEIQLSKLEQNQKSSFRFDKIGFILQASNLIPFLRVKDQLTIYNKVNKTKVDSIWLEKLFTDLDIKKLENKYPNELSGGERQRVAIAKSLYHKPAIILADEPTASLDTKRAYEVIKILQDVTKSQRKATIIVTHDERLLTYCDSIYRIVDGKITKEK